MGFLANFKIRSKLLVAMLPLALMAIGAGVYSSIESKKIDTWYSNLIDNYVKTFQSATAARADMMRFRLLLYQLLAEDKLIGKVKNGGSGVWGTIPMPPNNVPDADIKVLVEWVLSLQ